MLKNIRALIADDDPFIREMLTEILQAEGCTVKTAGSGHEAYDNFKADPDINIVISDMNMPGMNGLQLIGKLRDMGSDVPVVMLTGNIEISAAPEAVNCGNIDYLIKDEYIPETVVSLLRKVLQRHQRKQTNSGDASG